MTVSPVVVDLVVIAVILLSALLAFMRGFLREVLSIGAWIVAGFAAWFGWPLLAPVAGQYIDHELIAIAASAAAIFIVVLIVLTIVVHLLTRGVHQSALGPLDRSLGLLFGIVRGALIICVILMSTDYFYDRTQRPEWITQARSYPLVSAGADILYSVIPESLLKKGETAADTAKNQVQQAVEVGQAVQIITNAGQDDATDSAATGGDSGYKDAERNDLDRLIQGTQ